MGGGGGGGGGGNGKGDGGGNGKGDGGGVDGGVMGGADGGVHCGPKHRRLDGPARSCELEPTVSTPGVHTSECTFTSEPSPLMHTCSALVTLPPSHVGIHAELSRHSPLPPPDHVTTWA